MRRALGSLPEGSPWSRRVSEAAKGDAGVGVHLAVFVEPYLSAVLDGRKTIESRFGVHRCAPYEQVGPGDLILLKRSGGPVVGIALAGETSFHQLDGGALRDIRQRYARQLHAEDDGFWEARAGKRYATLIEIEEAVEIDTMTVEKRDRRGWVTMESSRQPTMAGLG